MKAKMETDTGKALYALRKQTVEPVFGIIKNVMGGRTRRVCLGEFAYSVILLLIAIFTAFMAVYKVIFPFPDFEQL